MADGRGKEAELMMTPTAEGTTGPLTQTPASWQHGLRTRHQSGQTGARRPAAPGQRWSVDTRTTPHSHPTSWTGTETTCLLINMLILPCFLSLPVSSYLFTWPHS